MGKLLALAIGFAIGYYYNVIKAWWGTRRGGNKLGDN